MHDTITIEPVAASHMLVYSTCSISLEGFIHFHGGSGVGSYTTLIKEYFPNATVLESLGIAGVSIRDASSKQTVENWLKKLGVDKQYVQGVWTMAYPTHLTVCPPTISEGYTSKMARNTSANDVFSLSLEVFLRIICNFAA